MERRFNCTACGKCCYGRLPLTLKDAVANAGRFPLAIMWSTVRQGAKAFAITERLGVMMNLGKKKRLALQITPVSYLPPSFACPALADDGLCSIHEEKPSRCRTMPFYPFREEADQADLLIPRPGWLCETSGNVSVVYRDKKILERDNFDKERQELLHQAPVLRAYAEGIMARAPNVVAGLEKAAKKPQGGSVTLNFTAVLSRFPEVDMVEFSRKQLPVLQEFANKTAGKKEDKEFHTYYLNSAAGMELYLGRQN